MPLYEYHCTSCGQRIEVLQRFSDAPLRECPQCGGALTKLISAPALQFKGSGFYLTDYGRGGSRSSTGESGKSEGAAEATSGTKDSTPAKDSAAASGGKASAGSQPATGGKPSADTKPAASPASSDKKAG
jgi:putative FmdB family regulatory protein